MKNVKITLLLELLVFVVASGLILSTYGIGFEKLTCFIDIPSIVGIFIIVIPFTLISGQGKDFHRAFSIGIKDYSLCEVKNTVDAIASVQRYVMYSGMIMFWMGLIYILVDLPDYSVLGPNIAVALISVFYTFILELFLLPLKANAVKNMNKLMDFDDEGK